MVVGENLNDDLGANAGAAHVFSRNHGGSNAWGRVKKLYAVDGGWSISESSP